MTAARRPAQHTPVGGAGYQNARKIINGLEPWKPIHGYAEMVEAILRASIVEG